MSWSYWFFSTVGAVNTKPGVSVELCERGVLRVNTHDSCACMCLFINQGVSWEWKLQPGLLFGIGALASQPQLPQQPVMFQWCFWKLCSLEAEVHARTVSWDLILFENDSLPCKKTIKRKLSVPWTLIRVELYHFDGWHSYYNFHPAQLVRKGLLNCQALLDNEGSINQKNQKMRLTSLLWAHSLGLGEFVTLQCPQRDERWSQRAGPVESPLLTGPEWRKGEDLKEGPQVNFNSCNICSIANWFHVYKYVSVLAHWNKQQNQWYIKCVWVVRKLCQPSTSVTFLTPLGFSTCSFSAGWKWLKTFTKMHQSLETSVRPTNKLL